MQTSQPPCEQNKSDVRSAKDGNCAEIVEPCVHDGEREYKGGEQRI